MSDIRQTSFTVSGALTRDEFNEAVKAVGLFRRMWLIVFVGSALIAFQSVSLSADGGSVRPVPLGVAVVFIAVWLGIVRVLTTRYYRAGHASEEKQTTADDTGITVSRSDETRQMAWRELSRYRETTRLHVLVGRRGRKACLLVVPKRLFGRPDESELFSTFLSNQVGRRH
ncbi:MULTISPECIES: YcxB family protein [Streptomyces]|uniref:YcxB-like C-terminal domain-containing protein n=1 Tax=Streptomyces viridochromogenes TaxID=1938 RepID=A0A0L8J5Z3_STRVR|nr:MULTISPECIES: YcxB family protein [Streptomyces]KOG08944.1 hypothetical protein ADK34_37885 [Streptomyces viridochromogenes]